MKTSSTSNLVNDPMDATDTDTAIGCLCRRPNGRLFIHDMSSNPGPRLLPIRRGSSLGSGAVVLTVFSIKAPPQ